MPVNLVSSVLIAKASVELDKIVEEELLVADPTNDGLSLDENTKRDDRTASAGND
jgi:hypothetical protein